MKVFEAVAAAIAAEGCDTVFGLMGDGNMALWSALASDPAIALRSAWHEAAAVSMADGFARATGRLGLATVTCGPGLTHAATPIVAAARGRVPMVVVVGEIPAADRRNIQRFDQRRFADACEAAFYAVTGPDTLAEEVRDAFHRARTERRPVLLNLPIDIQERQEVGPGWRYVPSGVPPRRGGAGARAGDPAFDALVDALARAERPVLLAGRGVLAAGARDEMLRLGDRIGALLATTLPAKDLFIDQPFDIGISGGFSSGVARTLLGEADLVLAVGAELGHFTAGEGRPVFPQAEVARIGLEEIAPERGLPAAIDVRGEARATLAALEEALEHRQVRGGGFRTPGTAAALAAGRTSAREPPADGLDPRQAMGELGRALPPGIRVTSGVGHYFNFVATHLPLPEDGRLEIAYAFGAIGSGLPVAIGARIGMAERPHLLVEGDGSLLQHLQELQTVVRYGLQLVVLVMNDGGYGAEVHKLGARGMDGGRAQWRSPDFVAIARAMGGDGVLVRADEELGPAVERGFAEGGLFLIDVRVSPTSMHERYETAFLGARTELPLLRRT